MNTNIRIFLKSISWQLIGLVVMTLIGYGFTGSFKISGGIAFVGMVIGFLTYFLHEKIWEYIRWGK